MNFIFTFTFTFTLESSTDSTAPIFTTPATTQRRYVRVLCAEFRPDLSRNMEGVGRHSFMPISKEELALKLFSRKFKPARQRFLQHVDAKFNENWTNGLMTDAG